MKDIRTKLSYIFDKSAKRTLVWLIFITIIGSILELVGVSVFMPFINIIMSEQNVYNNKYLNAIYTVLGFTQARQFMVFLCIVIILIYIIKNVFMIWQKNYIYKFSFNTQKRLATKLLDSYMKEPYTFHLSRNVAELQRSLNSDVTSFTTFVMQALELISELFVCLLMIVYLFIVSKTITIIVAGLMSVVVFSFLFATRKLSQGLGRETQIYSGKVYQWINQSIGGIKELKVLGREQLFLDSFNSYYDKLVVALRILRLVSMVPKYIVEAVCMTGLLISIIIKLIFGEAEMIYYIPQLTVFAVAAFRLMPSVGRINGYVTQMMSAMPSVNLIYQDLKEVADYTEAHNTENSTEEWNLQSSIHINQVSYRYPDGIEDVLSNISFQIPKGKTVALIGPSGAGKSTLVDVILGILEPTTGHVMADDMDVHHNPIKWHRQIGYIPQSIYLADDSIRANIAFGVNNTDIDEEALIRAAKQAQLDEFIKTLPEGYDTFVGDRGVRLSGGQRQRIGIARALYHNPEILVLDEATSALDNDTEAAVMKAIDQLQGSKTMIIIAHRLTTIRNADLIFEVVDTKIIPKTHEEVLD